MKYNFLALCILLLAVSAFALDRRHHAKRHSLKHKHNRFHKKSHRHHRSHQALTGEFTVSALPAGQAGQAVPVQGQAGQAQPQAAKQQQAPPASRFRKEDTTEAPVVQGQAQVKPQPQAQAGPAVPLTFKGSVDLTADKQGMTITADAATPIPAEFAAALNDKGVLDWAHVVGCEFGASETGLEFTTNGPSAWSVKFTGAPAQQAPAQQGAAKPAQGQASEAVAKQAPVSSRRRFQAVGAKAACGARQAGVGQAVVAQQTPADLTKIDTAPVVGQDAPVAPARRHRNRRNRRHY